MLGLLLVLAVATNAAAAGTTISNEHLTATLGPGGITALQPARGPAFTVADDGFALGLLGAAPQGIDSATLPAPTVAAHNSSALVLSFSHSLAAINVTYSLPPGRTVVTKRLSIQPAAGSAALNLTSVAPLRGLAASAGGCTAAGSAVASSHYGFKDYAGFQRFNCSAASSIGLMFAVANPFLTVNATDKLTISYPPNTLLSPSAPTVCDAAVIGAYEASGVTMPSPAAPLDEAEREAFSRAVAQLATTPNPTSTVKINVAWTENDFQIDVATEAGRTEYKRIIDRCSELGITHILFAPRNSDISSRQNGTDNW